MKILIDIEQELYNEIMSRKYSKTRLEKAVANGAPLPKHHGRLIDADWVKNTLDIHVINEYNGQFIRRSDIDTIPTIIEGE